MRSPAPRAGGKALNPGLTLLAALAVALAIVAPRASGAADSDIPHGSCNVTSGGIGSGGNTVTCNFGMPQELRHFARCVQGKEEPLLTGEDGRLVLEIMLAAYASAREGRKVALPFRPSGVRRPIDLWRPPAEG